MAKSQIRALLVEDNPGDARLVEELLKEVDAPVKLTWAKTLDDGVQKVLKDQPDVVILDLSLPDSRGLESVPNMHLFDTGVPIVVLTSLADPEAPFQAIRDGAQEYLVKGKADGAALLKAMRFAMQRAQVQLRLQEQRQSDEKAGTTTPPAIVQALVCPTGVGLVPVLSEYVASLQADGARILYVCLDRPAVVLRDPFLQSGADGKRITFLDAASGHREKPGGDGVVYADAKEDLQALGLRIEEIVGELGSRTYVLVDSINSLLLHHSLEKVAGFVHYLANRLRLLGIPGGVIAHQNQEWMVLADRFASFLDGEMSLRMDEERASSRADDPGFA